MKCIIQIKTTRGSMSSMSFVSKRDPPPKYRPTDACRDAIEKPANYFNRLPLLNVQNKVKQAKVNLRMSRVSYLRFALVWSREEVSSWSVPSIILLGKF